MRLRRFSFKQHAFFEFYCPLCKITKRSFYWPKPQFRHYMGIFSLGIAMGMALWPFFGAKGAFWIFPVWGVFEFFYRARARQSIICTRCGFDPYAYKFNFELAKQKVEAHFAAVKKARGESMTVSGPLNPKTSNANIEAHLTAALTANESKNGARVTKAKNRELG